LLIFWQLALIEVLVFLSIRKTLKNLRNSATVYLNVVLGIHVVLMIVSLLGFSFLLGENSFPGALTPISFMWLMTFGAVFVALRVLIKENRIKYGFIQFAILIIAIFILTYTAVSNQILNLDFFLFCQFIFFAMVFLLLKAHKSRNTNEESLSISLVLSYRILNFVSLLLLVALPILVFLLKIQPSSSPESTVYFSLILSLLPSVFLLKYGRRLSKTLSISKWLFAHLWVVDRRSRINFKLNLSKNLRLILLSIVFTYSIFIFFIDLSAKELNQELAKSAQVNQSSTSKDNKDSTSVGIESLPAKNQDEDSSKLSDQDWLKKIVSGLQLRTAPISIVSNISTLAVNRSFSSKTCEKTVSADFQNSSEVYFCKSEILNAPLALFVGNSHAAMLQDAVGQSLNELGYSENGIFTSSCTISPKVIPLLNSTRVDKCKNFGEDIARYVKNKKPKIIIVAEDLNVSVVNAAGSSVMGAFAASFLITNLQDSIRSFQSTTSKIILIDAFPTFPKISTCMGPSGSLTSSCVTTTSSTDIYRGINKIIASNTGAALISTLPWVCFQGRCPVIIDDTLVSPDGSHLTGQFARLLQPTITEALDFHITKFK